MSLIVLLSLLVASIPARAASPDDQYLKIYDLIGQADALVKNGQTNAALAKYREAHSDLQELRSDYPTWNRRLVNYRLNYIAEKYTALTKPTAASAESTEATNQTAASGETASATVAASRQVKLLDAGSKPRQVLRLHVKPGDKQTLDWTVKNSMEMAMGATGGQTMKMPAITFTIDSTVKNVSQEGDITYALDFRDVKVADEAGAMPQMVAGMKSVLAGLKGASGTGTMSDQGLSKRQTQIKMPPGSQPQLRQTIEELRESLVGIRVPLPKEAVGPGARWQVTTPLKSQGMTIQQTATYQLVSADPHGLQAKITLHQEAAHQKMQNPTMPGIKANLIKMTGDGIGTMTFALDQLLPSAANLDSHAEIHMGMNTGRGSQTMTMKVHSATKVKEQ